MRLLTLTAAVLAALISPALAQQGQINGVITDSSGAVVPGVAVTAVEQQTGLARETISGANGCTHSLHCGRRFMKSGLC